MKNYKGIETMALTSKQVLVITDKGLYGVQNSDGSYGLTNKENATMFTCVGAAKDAIKYLRKNVYVGNYRYEKQRRVKTMKNKMSIWIISHPWCIVDDIRGYEWELYNHDKPVAKSSPAHGDTYYYQKRSAIASAIRMRKMLFPCEYSRKRLRAICPIKDVTNRGRKNQKVHII